VKRQRADFHHTTALARVNDVIYLEDLQVRNVVRSHHLARSISLLEGFLEIRPIRTASIGPSPDVRSFSGYSAQHRADWRPTRRKRA
jgi:hypothetical protein